MGVLGEKMGFAPYSDPKKIEKMADFCGFAGVFMAGGAVVFLVFCDGVVKC